MLWVLVTTSDGLERSLTVDYNCTGSQLKEKLVLKLHLGLNEMHYFGLVQNGKWIHNEEEPLIGQLHVKIECEYPIRITFKPKILLHPAGLETHEARMHYFHSISSDIVKGKCYLSRQQSIEFHILQKKVCTFLKMDCELIEVPRQTKNPNSKIKEANETTEIMGISFDQCLQMFLSRASELPLNGLHQFPVKCNRRRGMVRIAMNSLNIYSIDQRISKPKPRLSQSIPFKDIKQFKTANLTKKMKIATQDAAKIVLKFSSKAEASTFTETFAAFLKFKDRILDTQSVSPLAQRPLPSMSRRPTQTAASQVKKPLPNNPKAISTVLESEIRGIQRGIYCRQCNERQIRTAYYPCLHACHCVQCAAKAGEQCAVCGAKIDTLLQHYWS
eukprot:m.39881 g.39881  ORF g.39881 m.39881 type:complete len:387 (+) comp32862_c0_seq1:56-1216(+)